MIVSLEKRKRGALHFLLQVWGGFSVWRSRKIFRPTKLNRTSVILLHRVYFFSFLEHTYSSVHEQKPTTG